MEHIYLHFQRDPNPDYSSSGYVVAPGTVSLAEAGRGSRGVLTPSPVQTGWRPRYDTGTASLAASINDYIFENGRRYHIYYGKDKNLLPDDEVCVCRPFVAPAISCSFSLFLFFFGCFFLVAF